MVLLEVKMMAEFKTARLLENVLEAAGLSDPLLSFAPKTRWQNTSFLDWSERQSGTHSDRTLVTEESSESSQLSSPLSVPEC